MRKKLFKVVPALVLAATMAASMLSAAACVTKKDTLPPGGQITGLTDKALEGEFLADFREGESTRFFESDGWGNASVFNTYWKADRVAYADEVMKLTIAQPDEPYVEEVRNDKNEVIGENIYEYAGGEVRSYAHYGYGDYEVRMKPAKKDGTTSTFFVCTGNYDTNPETGEPNPWDEIDIEFLGQDTTTVQFNYYINGTGGHEYVYDLGFDASEEFHNYGFRWEEDAITWFVDGEPVFKINGDEDIPIPSAAGRILMNYWCGTEEAVGWMGEYSDPGEEGPVYEWVKTSAAVDWTDANDPNLPKEPVDKYEGEWGEAVTPEFVSSTEGLYTVENNGASADVSYTNVAANSYQNVSTDITEAAADKNWITFKIKNNGETAPRIRINIVNKDDPAKAVVLNDYGYCGDDELEKVDGNFIEVPAGETKEIVIKYKGTAHSLELMIDSANTSGGPYAGDITVSDIKFGREGEIEELPQAPEDITVNGEKVAIAGNIASNGGKYNVTNIQNGINVKYEGVTGTDYSNVELKTEAIAPSNNTLTFKITNNGEAAVNVRVNVQATIASSANTNACNISATMNGSGVYTDKDWGGSMFDAIQPGATVEIAVKYDSSKQPTTVQFMIDSHKGESDTVIHSGDIDITDIAFSNDGSVPEQPDEPVVVPEDGSVNLTFFPESAGNKYTVDTTAATDSVTMSYTDIGGSDYAFLSTNDAAQYANGKDTFTITLKNNGESAVSVRVDIAGTTKVDNGLGGKSKILNTAAVASDGRHVDTNLAWGGSTVVLEAGEEVTLVISYDESTPKGNATAVLVSCDSHRGDANKYSGNVTISGFKFTSSSAAE